MSNKKPTKKMIEEVEAFNKLYPIGTELIVADDFGVETKRTNEAPSPLLRVGLVISRILFGI